MNPVAFESTLDQAYALILSTNGEITPEVSDMLAIVEKQKELAITYFTNRRIDRELLIADRKGRIAYHQEQIKALEDANLHDQSVIETADKYLIYLIENSTDDKGKPLSKVVINGQTVKVTQGTSNVLVIDDESLVPIQFKKATITIPADRLDIVKVVLSDDEINNVKIAVEKAQIKKSGVEVPGTHTEITTTKHIKREG